MINLSISDINSFLLCRRSWDFSSSNRQSLRKDTFNPNFLIGSGVHEAIDAQASGLDPLTALDTFLAEEKDKFPEVNSEKFEEAAELAVILVKQYFNHYGWETPLEHLDLEYIGTEIPFEIPLTEGVNFVGTIDGLAVDKGTRSALYVMENKTYGRKPNLDLVASGNQYKGYNWAIRALTGVKPWGTVYNGIMKKEIRSPKLLQSGKLSKDKNQSVTLSSYLEAIQKNGLDPFDYLDMLNFLEERERNGDDRFFLQDVFTYSDRQLDKWYETVLSSVVQEVTSDPLIYPNFNSCENCSVRDLCQAVEFGEDVEAVKKARYKVGTYGTMQAMEYAEPQMVTTLKDLMETINAD